MDNRPIGLFDSGLGGLSVLKSFVEAMPEESFIYYGDNGNAPYGDKPVEEITRLSMDCCRFLIDRGVKVIVVACNTASAASLTAMREGFDLPIVAMEPAIRPASQMLQGGKMLVMATTNTLSLNHYQSRIREIGMVEKAINLPCREIVDMVERGQMDTPEMDGLINSLLRPLAGENVDVVVLGCTHFIHVYDTIYRIASSIWEGVKVIDGNEGTTRQLQRVLLQHGLEGGNTERYVEFHTSGEDEVYFPLFKELINRPLPRQH